MAINIDETESKWHKASAQIDIKGFEEGYIGPGKLDQEQLQKYSIQDLPHNILIDRSGIK